MAKRTTSLRVLRGILCGTGAAVTTGIISPIQPSVGFPVATRLRMIWKQKTLLPRKIISCT